MRKSCHKFFDFEKTFDLTNFSASTYHKNRGRTFLRCPRHSRVSQSPAISSKRPKCANLAPAGTNAYKTVGNRRFNRKKKLVLKFFSKLFFQSRVALFSPISKKRVPGGNPSGVFVRDKFWPQDEFEFDRAAKIQIQIRRYLREHFR